MANQFRGDIELKIEGRAVTLRPSFEGLSEMEDRAGRGINAIASRFTAGGQGVKDVAAVIYGGLVGGGHREFSYNDVGEIILREGFYTYSAAAMQLLRHALVPQTEDDAEGKAQAAPQAAHEPSAKVSEPLGAAT